uniref:Uncharacterized protein n=1 Tax=Romanomermis culicivorax TaxID=13658 RepID=A0A915L3C6_ROMCU
MKKAALAAGNYAPPECFIDEPLKPACNMFQIGQKLEACDTRDPVFVCPATVKDVKEEKILVEFDGWNTSEWLRYDSRDIFPVGWWQRSGAKIQNVPSKRKRGGHQGQKNRDSLTTTAGSSETPTTPDIVVPTKENSSVVDKLNGDIGNLFDRTTSNSDSASKVQPEKDYTYDVGFGAKSRKLHIMKRNQNLSESSLVVCVRNARDHMLNDQTEAKSSAPILPADQSDMPSFPLVTAAEKCFGIVKPRAKKTIAAASVAPMMRPTKSITPPLSSPGYITETPVSRRGGNNTSLSAGQLSSIEDAVESVLAASGAFGSQSTTNNNSSQNIKRLHSPVQRPSSAAELDVNGRHRSSSAAALSKQQFSLIYNSPPLDGTPDTCDCK